MYCSNCSKIIKDDSKFCQFCGADQKDENDSAELLSQKHHNSNSKTKHRAISSRYLLVVALAVVVVLCSVIYIFVRPEKSEKFITMLKDGKYAEAAVYYQSDLVGDEEELKKTYETITTEINAIVHSYYSDNLSYDDAKNGLSAYSDFYSTETNKALQRIGRLKESKDIFLRAEQKYDVEDFKGAYKLYLKVIEEDSNIDAAKEKITACYDAISAQIFAVSAAMASEGEWIQAINYLDSEYDFLNTEEQTSASNKMNEYAQAYVTNEINAAIVYLEKNEYLAALEELKMAVSVIGDNSDLDDTIQMVSESYENYIYNQAYEKIQNNDYLAAMDIIYKASEELPSSNVLSGYRMSVEVAYENYVSKKVKEKISSRDFLAAAEILTMAKGVMPSSNIFAELTSLLAEYTPVSIYTLEPYNVGLVSLNVNKNYEDNMGNVYEKTFRITSKNDVYNVYDISQKYSILSGIVAIAKESVGGAGVGYIKIYGDNILLWEDTNITASTKPYEMSVNISGVTDLKIEISRGASVHVLFADVTLQK